MAIVWGDVINNLQVGVEVVTETPSINVLNVIGNFYVNVTTGYYNDNQHLTVSGSRAGEWDYYLSSGTAYPLFIGSVRIDSQWQTPSGGPTYQFYGRITGVYTGIEPEVNYYWTLPPQTVYAPTITATSVSNITTSSVTINQNGVNANGSAIDAIQVQVSTSSSFATVQHDLTGATYSPSITGLTRGTQYYARSRVHNALGWSAWTAGVGFRTLATVPAAPAAPALSSTTPTTLVATWVAPDNGGSAITGYDLQYARDAAFTVGVITLAGVSSPRTITGLTSATRYWVRVRAKNVVGVSGWSSAATVTTRPGIHVRVAGTWRTAIPWVRVAGTWRQARAWVRVAGTWR
jgi:hypothetical protein